MSVPDLRRHIAPGDGVWWGQAAAEARPLIDALLDQVGDIGPVRAFGGIGGHRRLARHLPGNLTVVSYGAMGELRGVPRLEVGVARSPTARGAWRRSPLLSTATHSCDLREKGQQ